MAGINTVLNYTIVPNPVHVGGNPQDIVIIATLKSTAEFGKIGQKQKPLTSATIEKIVIDFGPATGDANSLTSSTNAITSENFSPTEDWIVSNVNDSNGNAIPNTVEVKPNGSGQIINDAIVLTVLAVQVSSHQGSVSITITETVSKINKSAKLPPPHTATNQTSLTLAKVEEKTISENTFTSTHYYIQSGEDVKLKWTVADVTPISLHYISGGKFVNTQNNAGGNNYPGITKHADGTALQPHDSYPNSQYDDPIDALKLTDTTTFILKVGSGSTVQYLTCTVIVEDSELYARKANIGDKSLESTPTLNLIGQMTLNDGQGNGVFNANQGFKLWSHSDPTQPKEVANFTSDGSVYVPNGFSTGGQVSGGSISTAGDIAAGNMNLTGSVTSDLNVKGDITVSGSVKSSTEYTNDNTPKSVGGWGGGSATWNTGYISSSGGATIGGLSGFSYTYGNGNLGYYCLNLQGVFEGILEVDMYLANYNGPGLGFFYIMSSTGELNSNGRFDGISQSRVLWSSYHKPAWFYGFNGADIQRVTMRMYFNGQFIYIGARDLNDGQLAIAISRVRAFSLT